MYRIKTSCIPLLSILLLFMFFGVAPLFPQPARAADGQIVFYGEGPQDDTQPGDVLCSLPFVTGEYNFKEMDNCQNDEARWFKLVDVPSATRFELWDHPDCDDANALDFYFIMKTVKHNLTMEQPIKIKSLAAVAEGQIVPGAPGVRLEYGWVTADDPHIDGKLSCVKIVRSAVPEP